MKTILSTKLLTPDQKEILTDAGFHLTEYEAIKIHFNEFELTEGFDYFIFTSQNAVRAFLKHKLNFYKEKELALGCFCVGEKTKLLLEQNGQKVLKTTQNASDLGHFISKYYKNESFLFFCGNRRINDLPDILLNNEIRFEEIEVYQTILKPHHFSEPFDGVLFYSPSGVKSFISENGLGTSTVFCIGDTTAREAEKYADSIVVADTPSVENLMKKVILHYNLNIEK
jgi:uroporphyrinogen-III synthase